MFQQQSRSIGYAMVAKPRLHFSATRHRIVLHSQTLCHHITIYLLLSIKQCVQVFGVVISLHCKQATQTNFQCKSVIVKMA